MLKKLINGNYFIYQLRFGGCGIVKAKNSAEAITNIIDAYRRHDGSEYAVGDINCKNIADIGITFTIDKPNVIELGWKLEL